MLKLRPGSFQQSLLHLFLAGDTVAGPRHCFEALGIDLVTAGNTLPEAAFADTFQSAFYHLQSLALTTALAEEKFLGIGICGAIGDILGGFDVGLASILGGAADCVAQFSLPFFQPLLKCVQLLFVHSTPPRLLSQPVV